MFQVKISDIFPSNILTSRPENIDYLYMSNRFAGTLKIIKQLLRAY